MREENALQRADRLIRRPAGLPQLPTNPTKEGPVHLGERCCPGETGAAGLSPRERRLEFHDGFMTLAGVWGTFRGHDLLALS